MTIDTLLLLVNHGFQATRRIAYSRADSTEHVAFEDLKNCNSGVILDAALVILKLSESKRYYDYFQFYERMVNYMVSIFAILIFSYKLGFLTIAAISDS